MSFWNNENILQLESGKRIVKTLQSIFVIILSLHHFNNKNVYLLKVMLIERTTNEEKKEKKRIKERRNRNRPEALKTFPRETLLEWQELYSFTGTNVKTHGQWQL